MTAATNPLQGVDTDVLQRWYWTMPVHTDEAAAKLDIIQAELVRRGVGLRDAVSTPRTRCENVGVCIWCDAEVGDNHLCELMCLAASSVILIEQRRKESLS